MVFKSIGWGRGDDVPESRERALPKARTTPRQEGGLVGLVGESNGGGFANEPASEHYERLFKVDGGVLGYNLDGKMVLMRYEKNERGFDHYIGLPFTKGVTERGTGRTLLILGSAAHHGDAMQNQFEGVIWKPDAAEEMKRYGDTIRWINVGDLKQGFIGLDYKPQATAEDGVARSPEEVAFLAATLLSFGYDPSKRLFLLDPPYIVESSYGKQMRKQGKETLMDYVKKK
ncbi:hypothetical protein HZB02_03345 [Candidatus Woesearchaeota archaeon]|nr:hypothetical protein [Candidatus Woesearchaeota archaeon]